MVALWMCYATLVTALLAAGAWAADEAFAAFGAPRRWAWAAAVAGGLALPAWAGRRPARGPDAVPAAVSVAATNSAAAAPAPDPFGRPQLGPPPLAAPLRPARALGAVRGRAERATAAAARALAPLDRPLLALWLIASTAGALFLARGAWAVRRRRRGWRAALVAGERVWLAPDLGPALVGALRPRVVLPEWAVGALDAGEVRLVLAHERAHAAAGDPLLLALALGALVLAPWNAGLWLAARRLRLAAEADCDRRVLRAHPDARRYARLLVDVAERALGAGGVGGTGAMATALLDPPGLLERRVAWLLGADSDTHARRGARAAGAAVGALGVVALACAVPRPTPAPAATRTRVPTAAEARSDARAAAPRRRSCVGDAACVDSMGRVIDTVGDVDTAAWREAAARAERRNAAMTAELRARAESARVQQEAEWARIWARAASDSAAQAREMARMVARADSAAAAQTLKIIRTVDAMDSAARARDAAFGRIEAMLHTNSRSRDLAMQRAVAARNAQVPVHLVATNIRFAAPDTNTNPAEAHRLHDIARAVMTSAPHGAGRHLVVVLFDSAGHVQRTAVRPLGAADRATISIDDAQHTFPELGGRPVRVGSMTWLAPGDSNYVAWAMPEARR